MFYFDSVAEALNMGGHGVYVWVSYAITALVIAVLMVQPMLAMKRQKKKFLEAVKRDQRAQRSSDASSS